MAILKFSVFDIETIPLQSLPDDLRPQPDMTKVKYGNTKNAFERQRIEAAYVADFESKIDKIMSLDPYLCQVCCLMGYDSWNDEFITLAATDETHERGLLESFWYWVARRYQEDIPIVSFNGASLDLPILIARTMLQDLAVDPAMLQALQKRQDYNNHQHIDLMQRLGTRNPFSNQLQVHKLDWYCRRFNLPGKQDDMDGSKVYPMFKEGRLDEIVKYCRQDVLATAALFERVKPWLHRVPIKSFDTSKTEEV